MKANIQITTLAVCYFLMICCATPFSWAQTTVSDNKQRKRSRITNQDKAEIVRLMLEGGVVSNLIPDPGLRGVKNQVILLTQNIKPEWVPKVPGVRFMLLTPNQVQKKADREGDFMYLFFSMLQVKEGKVNSSHLGISY